MKDFTASRSNPSVSPNGHGEVSQRNPDCTWGCASTDDCTGGCGDLPPRLSNLPAADFYALLDFANEVQSWSFAREGDTTFAEAAEHLAVPVEKIADAVAAHYWMLTPDTDLPLAERRIEHDGE